MHTPAAQRWRPIVRRARQSGVSIREFARQNGINEHTLSWWNWRLGANFDETTFVELAVAHEERSRPLLRVHLGSAWVDVDAASDLALLRRLVEALS
jgi:transposase-like protein